MRSSRNAAFVAFCALASPVLGGTWYVDATAPVGGNGLSWSASFPDLQSALSAATPGDVVRVAAGTYFPGPIGSPRSLTFTIPAGVTVLGGLQGRGSATPDVASANPSILHGDLGRNDLPNRVNRAENASSVVTSSAHGATIEGFTITAGQTQSGFAAGGSGIRITGGDIRVVDCRFLDNVSLASGGGAGVFDASPRFERCAFENNSAQQTGGGVHASGNSSVTLRDCKVEANVGGVGAGLAITGPSQAFVERCEFLSNVGQIGTGSGPGAAVSARFSPTVVPASATFLECRFDSNSTGAGGGGIISFDSDVTIRRCVFTRNSALFDGGGGVYFDGGSILLESSSFVDNHTRSAGLAIFVAPGTNASVANCTITGNTDTGAPLTSVASVYVLGSLSLSNSILWNNRDGLGTGQSAQIRSASSGSVQFSNSIIQGWTGVFNAVPVPPAANVFGVDPRFVDADGADGILGTIDDDLRLAIGSPAIDAGTSSVLTPDSMLDLVRGPRVVGEAVDLGAIERPCLADLDDDGNIAVATPDLAVDINDLLYFLEAFEVGSSGVDLTGDNAVDVDDLLSFLAHFESGC